ncbi:MAG: glycosyltransferase family 2 protein [Alphaproteobacteria bacterium]|nr:glycosyltransferase family 2 protein [Alphaproteobacteria bacterium]
MDPQPPFDAAVVIPTMLRQSLLGAVRSVFAQTLAGRVQILIGIDKPLGERTVVDRLRAECPSHMHLTLLDLGYSTSVRHGGIYSNAYSGALRTIPSYAANSARVAYLDDDNWWGPDHLSDLAQALDGHDWAFSQRWYVDPATDVPLTIDRWESVGIGGAFSETFGGFVDTSSLMLEKGRCHMVFPLWAIAMFPKGSGEDRMVFQALKEMAGRTTGKATSFYRLNPADGNHGRRLEWIAAARAGTESDPR